MNKKLSATDRIICLNLRNLVFLLPPPKSLFEIVFVCKHKTHGSVNKPMGNELEFMRAKTFNKLVEGQLDYVKLDMVFQLGSSCNRKTQFEFRKQIILR